MVSAAAVVSAAGVLVAAVLAAAVPAEAGKLFNQSPLKKQKFTSVSNVSRSLPGVLSLIKN